MAVTATTSKLLGHLRRSRTLIYSSTLCSTSCCCCPSYPLLLHHFDSAPDSSFSQFHFQFQFKSNRSFSSSSSSSPEFSSLSSPFPGSIPDPDQLLDSGPVLPVQLLIDLLDFYHNVTGFPWWLVIASSTVAMRLSLFPVLVLQFRKLKTISEIFPKLPPPIPPPFSGRSFIRQFKLFQRERRAAGCPSFLWFLAFVSLQIPCFLLWVTTIRRMSLDHHPGFDSGGILWFQNLTECPHGYLGAILPLMIGFLHFTSIQISFPASLARQKGSWLGAYAKYYKYYLQSVTIPITYVGFSIPQGSLVYWVTNVSLTIIQQLALKNSTIREKLGLPEDRSSQPAAQLDDAETPDVKPLNLSAPPEDESMQKLSPRKLIALSLQLLSKGKQDEAIPLVKLALDKDPEFTMAMVVMGQILVQRGLLEEATEYLERAITKLFRAIDMNEDDYVQQLVVASQWAGIVYAKQDKFAEAIVHLERIASLEEPQESQNKAHYYSGLVLLACALFEVDRKADAVKYLRMAAAYDPGYNDLLERCEKDDENLVGDLVHSRRRDY